MRILLFSHDKTLFREGSETKTRMIERWSICDALTIVVPTAPGFIEQQLVRNVRVVPTNSKSRFWSFWDLQKVGKKIIEREQIDFVISGDPFELGWVAMKLAKKFNLPWQVELHGDFYSTSYWQWSSPANFLRHHVGKHVLRGTCCIRAVSERVRASLAMRLGIPDSRIAVFPVETDITKLLANPRGTHLKGAYGNFDFFLLCVCTLNAVKNVGMQIRALHDIVKKHPKTALIIIGEGPERPVLEMMAERMHVAQNIIFTGMQKDLSPYYASADAFALTSHAEGWGRAVVEAMASELPVITTDVGLAGEFLLNGKNGIVIARGDERMLTRAVCQLIQDPDLRARLGREARESAKKLPSHTDMLRIYKENWEKCTHHA